MITQQIIEDEFQRQRDMLCDALDNAGVGVRDVALTDTPPDAAIALIQSYAKNIGVDMEGLTEFCGNYAMSNLDLLLAFGPDPDDSPEGFYDNLACGIATTMTRAFLLGVILGREYRP